MHPLRFYDRQFVSRNEANLDVLDQFEKLLSEYYQSDKPQTIGLPSVTYCAEQINLSTNYFGDLIKKETGKTASEYIRLKIMAWAKQKILEDKKTINEIAYELGFKYPAHFTRAFKKSTGVTPIAYRALNLCVPPMKATVGTHLNIL